MRGVFAIVFSPCAPVSQYHGGAVNGIRDGGRLPCFFSSFPPRDLSVAAEFNGGTPPYNRWRGGRLLWWMPAVQCVPDGCAMGHGCSMSD